MAPTTITFGAPPSRFDLARLAPVAALVAVIVVLAAGLAAVTRHHPVGRWDGRVTDLVSFVETERGLTFKHPVPVEFLPVATFKKKVGTTKPMSAADRRQLEAAVGELRALGLAAGPLDLQALERQLVEEGVIGLYRPADKRIYVRGTDLTPAVKVTLVHELTHALQDQHVDLGKIGQGTSASESSIRALVEGDAVQVERAYVRQLSPDERQSYIDASENDRSSADLGGIPQVLIDDFSFPYAFGPTFIAALKAFGGTASIDAALRRPPVTDAQIVNPDLYLTNTKVVAVATPSVPKGDEVVGRPQRFGIVDMLQVLGARVGFSQAWSALKGWRGDREVLYRDHGTLCVAVATAVDTPASADALSVALAAWSKAVPGGTSTRDGDVVALRACDPGTAAPALPSATPEPFKVLAARAGIIEGVLQSPSIPASAAACAADAVIAALSPAAVVAADAGERSLDPAAVRTALAGAVAGCGLSRAGSQASTPTTVAPPQPSVRLDRPLGAALTAPPVWPTPTDARAAVAAAGLSMLDGEGTAIHEHAHLRVVIDGQEVVVPGEIGIDASRGLLSPLHTHNTSGIVHIESDEPEPFTVGQVFTEWGRPIGRDHIGSMHFGADRTMHVFVNGAEVTGDPSLVVWHEHDDVVIDVERTGSSVPAPRHYIWPPGF